MEDPARAVYSSQVEPFPYTRVRKWVTHLDVKPGGRHFWEVVRSLIPDGGERAEDRMTQPLSMDQLCWLLTTSTEDPVGRTTAKRWRDEAVAAGLVERQPTKRKNDPARYLVKDFPDRGVPYWRSTWEKLSAYHEDWRVSPAPPPHGQVDKPGHCGGPDLDQNTCSAQIWTSDGPDMDRGGPNMAHLPVSDLGKLPPKKRVEEAPEEALSPYPLKEGGESETLEISAQRVAQAAEGVADRLGCQLGKKTRQQIVAHVEEAVQGGLPPSRALAYLTSKASGTVHSPDRLHAANVQDLPAPASGDEEAWLKELCPRCDEHGLASREEYASKDPLALKSVCLHGRPDPWDDDAYRTAQEAVRSAGLRRFQERAQRAEERRQRAIQQHRERQRAKGIDCACVHDRKCPPCQTAEARSA